MHVSAHVRSVAGIAALGLIAAVAAVALVALALVAPWAFAQGTDAGAYRIGPKDLLDIRVFEVPELNVERRVTESGTVSLPLIGDVEIAGLTPSAAAARLKGLLESRYVQRASVEIQVREFRSRPITVIGAVRQPGPLAFPGRMTLLEAVAAAGGLAEKHADTIHVLRRAENGLSDQIGIPVADLLVKGDPKANIPIFANDLINVPSQVDVTVYCVGEVAAPGAITFGSNERVTLLAAIARAGGLSERAANKIRIKRQGAVGPAGEAEYDYRRILAGKDADPALAAGDVVVVKESFF